MLLLMSLALFGLGSKFNVVRSLDVRLLGFELLELGLAELENDSSYSSLGLKMSSSYLNSNYSSMIVVHIVVVVVVVRSVVVVAVVVGFVVVLVVGAF
ncbi:hypothetical protein AGMMS49921_08030 [Endomicrobiia bacterium]|nr:hypothetical protein AGMMS49921_08030 [Endomicrobiia bacterium]